MDDKVDCASLLQKSSTCHRNKPRACNNFEKVFGSLEIRKWKSNCFEWSQKKMKLVSQSWYFFHPWVSRNHLKHLLELHWIMEEPFRVEDQGAIVFLNMLSTLGGPSQNSLQFGYKLISKYILLNENFLRLLEEVMGGNGNNFDGQSAELKTLVKQQNKRNIKKWTVNIGIKRHEALLWSTLWWCAQNHDYINRKSHLGILRNVDTTGKELITGFAGA